MQKLHLLLPLLSQLLLHLLLKMQKLLRLPLLLSQLLMLSSNVSGLKKPRFAGVFFRLRFHFYL
jgi:hypothetical protein